MSDTDVERDTTSQGGRNEFEPLLFERPFILQEALVDSLEAK